MALGPTWGKNGPKMAKNGIWGHFSIFSPFLGHFFAISGRWPFSIFWPTFSHFGISARFPFYTRRPDSQPLFQKTPLSEPKINCYPQKRPEAALTQHKSRKYPPCREDYQISSAKIFSGNHRFPITDFSGNCPKLILPELFLAIALPIFPVILVHHQFTSPHTALRPGQTFR